MNQVDPGHGVYPISVAAELSGVDPQMLRTYEQRGLLTPSRTQGGTRRYSPDDLDRISDITRLLGDGLNLAGIGQVLQLREEAHRLAAQVGELRAAREPHRREIRQLRKQNRAPQDELENRNQPVQPIEQRPAARVPTTSERRTRPRDQESREAT
jgi:DNA-binding transcriptional MerR regulator